MLEPVNGSGGRDESEPEGDVPDRARCDVPESTHVPRSIDRAFTFVHRPDVIGFAVPASCLEYRDRLLIFVLNKGLC